MRVGDRLVALNGAEIGEGAGASPGELVRRGFELNRDGATRMLDAMGRCTGTCPAAGLMPSNV